jgi:hypothetical protein
MEIWSNLCKFSAFASIYLAAGSPDEPPMDFDTRSF